jgi:hemolysin activation/secretion protein
MDKNNFNFIFRKVFEDFCDEYFFATFHVLRVGVFGATCAQLHSYLTISIAFTFFIFSTSHQFLAYCLRRRNMVFLFSMTFTAVYAQPSSQTLPLQQSQQSTQSALSAQSAQKISEDGLRREEDRAKAQRDAAAMGSSELLPADKKSQTFLLPHEAVCSVISNITLEGPDAARFSWLLKFTDAYLMQCVGSRGLNIIVAALNDELLAQGLATSKISLPAQNLAGGLLTLHLHVGRVEAVRFEDKGSDWGTWRNAFLPMTGSVLDVRTLEQGVEQIKRLPSQNVATRIEPGSALDTSVVVIERTQGVLADRFRGGVTVDNSGSSSLGRAQFSANFALDNPLGLNDIVSLGLSSNLQALSATHRSQSLNLTYSIPLGFSLFSLNASTSQFAQKVQLTTTEVLSSGESKSLEARWQHTWLRSASSKFGSYVALSTRTAHSFIDDLELLVQRRRNSFLETGVAYKQLMKNASIDIELGVKRGLGWNKAQDDFAENAEGLTLRPKIWTLNASLTQGFELAGRRWNANTGLRAQHTHNTTTSVDQISIGGRGSVRGFDGESGLLAESGYVLRNEISTPIKGIDGLDTHFVAALDLGRVFGPSDSNLLGQNLAGLAFGLRGATRRLNFDVVFATPIYMPMGFKTRKLNPYLSLTYAF